MKKEAQEELVDDLDEVEDQIPVTYSITAYGADYPVDSLIPRIGSGDMVVPTFAWEPTDDSQIVGFQREYVWPKPKADKFIESLLLGLPVPGIFLVKEPSGLLLVLDGHQRLHTLHAFYEGVLAGKEYRLNNVQPRFDGKRYKDLDIEDRRRLDNSIMHATVIRQDEPSEDQSSIYVIFERLNTGGVNLQPQEIRVALYHGEFVRVLRELNEHDSWRKLYGRKSRRLKDMEMILRFFAFLFFLEKYHSPMKDFLNRYMAKNRNLNAQSEKKLTKIFHNTSDTIVRAIGAKAFRPYTAVNAAVVDSLMAGIAARLLKKGEITNDANVQKAYKSLLDNKQYMSAIQSGTSQESNVETRHKLTKAAFAKVG